MLPVGLDEQIAEMAAIKSCRSPSAAVREVMLGLTQYIF